MVINAEHPYTKFFTLWLDGEPIDDVFQYDTTLQVAAVGKEETARLFAWGLARSGGAGLQIGEEYEVRGGMFVRDVEGDFEVRIAKECPSRIQEEMQKWGR